jgi:SAM-dependent methyltransferase
LHKEQKDFCDAVKARFPEYFKGKWVIDCGSMDVNGSNCYLFEDCLYLGVDIFPGENVHIKCMIHEVPFVPFLFDVVISTNTFEHDKCWRKSIPHMCALLKPGGLMLFSCSRNWPEHGTARVHHGRSPTHTLPGWENYYMNLDEPDIRSAIDIENTFSEFEFSTSETGKDLFFWGIKHDEKTHTVLL